MFIRKWTPVRAPDTGVGSSDVEGDENALPASEIDDSLADERTESRKSIRGELESSFKKANEAAEKVEKTEKATGKGRDGRKGTALKSRASQELEADAADDADLDVEEPEVEETAEGDASQAPASLPKEARAEWAKTPKAVQAAWTKRDQDIDKGVKQLKASYAEIDQVLAPRAEILRQMGHTPAQAVGQLFSWFDALGLDPERVKNGQPPLALLALANSFGLDLSGAFQQQQKADPTKPGKEAAVAEGDDEISPAIRNHIAQLEARLAGFEQNVGQGFQNFQQTFATQAQEQTHKILNAWSEGKPHFEDVRLTMAKIIQAGMVAPKEDGSADLDKAYDMALYSHPEVREKVLADRRKAAIEKKRLAGLAEQKAQQQAADKARRTGAGLGPSAPGITLANEQKKPGKKSVRESIADAMSELGS